MSEVKAVWGAGPLGRMPWSEDLIQSMLEALAAGGVKDIDTAQLYPNSEKTLGEFKAGSKFSIDTKTVGGLIDQPELGTKEQVARDGKQSLKTLGVDKVDVFYIHAPIPQTPISSTLAGIQELYLAGAFSRFGLSNYTAEETVEVYNYCKEHGYVLPSVYQGNYSAVTRKPETELFPTLRKLGFAFYAYSPVAGGFLTKTREEVLEGKGRWAPVGAGGPGGGMYNALYVKPTYLEALDEWGRIADELACSKAELAYRWIKYNSVLKAEHGDAVIFGTSSMDQIHETLKALSAGPLDAKTAERIDGVWKQVEQDAPLDNYNDFIKIGGKLT